MKKIKMSRGITLTFEEGCNKYLENCRQRNLREGTIGHYKQSYTQFYKYFDPKMSIEDIDEQSYKDYVLHLKSALDNDVSINSYLRDLITTLIPVGLLKKEVTKSFSIKTVNMPKCSEFSLKNISLTTTLCKPNN